MYRPSSHTSVFTRTVLRIALSHPVDTMLSMATTPAAWQGHWEWPTGAAEQLRAFSAAHFCARSIRVHQSCIKSRLYRATCDRAVPVTRPGLLGTPGLVSILRTQERRHGRSALHLSDNQA